MIVKEPRRNSIIEKGLPTAISVPDSLLQKLLAMDCKTT
jgi:hypothetical protein